MENKGKAAKKNKGNKKIIYIIMIALSIVYMIPFVWLLSSSLKTDAEIFSMPPTWIPETIHWENYAEVFRQVPFLKFLGNTILVTVLVMIAHVVVSSLIGYAFARLQAPGKNVCFLLLLSTMMLPSQVTMIPLYIMFKELNWVDTLLPLIVPAFFGGSALYIFLFRQFFSSIPKSLDEAAMIDGAGYLNTYIKVLLPMSKPIVITVAIFSFMATWNDFMGPLIYLQSTENYTLALGMNLFKTQYVQNWNYTMAYNVMMILPVIVLFFLAQKSFIQGIVITGSK